MHLTTHAEPYGTSQLQLGLAATGPSCLAVTSEIYLTGLTIPSQELASLPFSQAVFWQPSSKGYPPFDRIKFAIEPSLQAMFAGLAVFLTLMVADWLHITAPKHE